MRLASTQNISSADISEAFLLIAHTVRRYNQEDHDLDVFVGGFRDSLLIQSVDGENIRLYTRIFTDRWQDSFPTTDNATQQRLHRKLGMIYTFESH